MDNKERCEDLLTTIKNLRNEVESLREGSAPIDAVNKSLLLKAFHSTTQLMAISNLETGAYEYVNNAFLNALGYSKEEIIGKTSQEIRLFTEIVQSDKFIRILKKFRKVQDVGITLRAKDGSGKQFLLSADTLFLGNVPYLLTYCQHVEGNITLSTIDDRNKVVREVFDTISNYIALFKPHNNRFIISDFNFKAAEVEFIDKDELIGKYLDETPLSRKTKLLEILNHVLITREPHKLAASPDGDDSEGFYTAFLLSSGEIVTYWEPRQFDRLKEKDFIKQGLIFERFGDILPIMIFELSLEGKVVYGNEKGLAHFGYTWEDVKKGVFLQSIFKEGLKYVLANLSALKNPENSIHNEYIAYKKDGEKIPISTYTFASFQDGEITGYRGIVIDIRDQKKFEKDIEKEKAFLEQFIDSTPEAIAMSDLDGKIIRINREFTRLFGYLPKEAIGRRINELVVPGDLIEEAIAIDESALQSQQEIPHTERINKYGRRIHVNLIASTISINDEPLASVGIYRDISAYRKTQILQETLLNISSQALKMSEVTDFYPVIIKEVSKIWDTNNFFIALYHKDKDTLSLPIFSDEKDHFEEIPASKTLSSWVMREGRSVLLKSADVAKLEELGEIGLVGTSSEVWLGVPLKVEEEIIGIMCLQDYNDEDRFTYEDLNGLEFIANQIAIGIQKRTMVENLVEARKKAEEAADAKHQFMSTMSHEIRTPLNEVIGITNLLLQSSPREDQMDFLKTLRFSANHLLTLVNDVLDYSKMESGNLVFEKTQFSLHDFLDDIIRSYSYKAQSKKIEFISDKDKSLPEEIVGDSLRLNQILSNLLSNAIKFTEKGAVRFSVHEVGRKENISSIQFSIKDTGIGIPEEMHEKIFESYTQAGIDTARKFGGTGLGLAICKKLVDLMGSKIELVSSAGEGSTFSFIFTFEIGQDFERASVENEKYDKLKGKKILVAEDNKVNFFVANKFLQGWGIDVTHAENGLIALEMIGKQDFDLVLMDLHMPVMDGIEASQIIRDSKNTLISKIPIIALTAAIMSDSKDRIQNIEINDYVLKPFKPKDLYDKIVKHIK